MSSTFSHQGNPGEVVWVEISSLSANVLLRNELPTVLKASMLWHTERYCVCRHSNSLQSHWWAGHHCCGHRERGEFQWQVYWCIMLYTNGCVCVEVDNNIFVTDAKQVPLSLIITPIKGTIGFLKRRGLLCKAFSVHLRHQTTAKLSITGTIRHLELLQRYLEEANKWILDNLTNCASLLVNMARFPTKQSHLSAWFWGRALKIFTSSLTISIQLSHLISTCALRSKWRTSMQWATLSCLRTAFQYALNTVYESMNNSVYKQSCSLDCGLLHTWLIVLSCCRTSNTSSCFS